MIEMTPDRWSYTSNYLQRVFGGEDEILATLSDRAKEAGLPDIAISADVGRLLSVLASTTRARSMLEVGTLAGYSAIWLARALAPGGRLTTLEKNPTHAQFAEATFARAGLGAQIEVITGDALETLPTVLDRGPFDVVFFDAVKADYLRYYQYVRDAVAVGGLILADNVTGSSSWWIDQEDDDTRRAVDAFNRTIAADPLFETACVPIRQGVLIARKRASEEI